MSKYYGVGTAPCIICKDKNGDYMRECALNNIDSLLQGIQPSQKPLHLEWDIHSRCGYGLHCPTLQQNDRQMKLIAQHITPRLTTVVYNNNEELYHMCFSYLQGFFPRVCQTIEREHYKALHQQ